MNWVLITVIIIANAACIATVIWIDLDDDNITWRGPFWRRLFWMLVIVNMLCWIAMVGELVIG
jgi:hypothetical protein